VPGSQTNLAWDTLLELSDDARGPLHERLSEALRTAIRSGRLPAGSALPPSRTLAADLACSRWAVTEAYAQLIAEGYLEGRTGSATRVRWAGEPPAADGRAARPAPDRPRFDLTPGLPDLRAFPRERWAAALRSQAARVPFPDLGYPPAGGHPRLRRVLADYLHRVRGAAGTGDDMTITTGVVDGLVRLSTALFTAGIRELAVEDPSEYAGDTMLSRSIGSTGLRIVPIPVDEQGLVVDELVARPALRAALITPAHQFPTGTVLAPGRRAALLEWARRVDGVVLEDDYDAEFRYDRRPVAAMQGMDPSRVCLLGSLSKTLSPALRIGWMVTPPAWTERRRRVAVTPSPSILDQLALAEFIETGAYDRHLRSMRHRYHLRRDALVDALRARLPECRVSGAAAGIHLLLHLGEKADAGAVVARALRLGVAVVSLDGFRVRGNGSDPGLVLSYGNLDDSRLQESVELLAAAVRDGGARRRA
jgi:GntR family transcriptional regulator / MocR family aminotransferase